MTERAAGWLSDPFDPQGSIRYWDGTRWTDDTLPAPVPPPTPLAPMPPAASDPTPEPSIPAPSMPTHPDPVPPPEEEPSSEPGTRRRLLVVVVLVALLGGAGWLLLSGDDAETSSTAVATTTSTAGDTSTTAAPTTTAATTSSTSTTTSTTSTTVPLIPLLDTVGMSAAEARAALEAAGLVVTVVEVEVEVDDVEPGTVIATIPASGAELLAGASVEIQVAVAPPPQCNDVPEPLPVAGFGDIGTLNAEGSTAAHWAAAVGLINDSTELNPRDPMSRAAVTTVLWRYFCEPPANISAGYPDVDAGAFYATAADWAAEQGYVTGTAEGTFNPDAPITRAQFVTIAWRAVGEPVPAGPSPFTDVAAGSFYSSALDWAFSEGLVGGTAANTFDPDGPLDRITSLILFYRLELNVDPAVTS